MARPRIHSDAAAKRAAHLTDRARLEVITSAQIAQTVAELAAQYDASKNEVINDLIRFALTNRDWKAQGLLWSMNRQRLSPSENPST
jgi:hypothetical protein